MILKDIKYFLLYGAALALLVFLLKWLQWKFLIIDHATDLYIGLVAVFFTILGIWIAKQFVKPNTATIFITQPQTFTIDKKALQELQLTGREYEILQLLAKGHSNTAIATQLFLSLSTIKTHASNLYVKMDVKSRTQAIEKGKRLNIIP